MTPERKRGIADEIIAAFKAKGLMPIANSFGNGITCACAVSAVLPPEHEVKGSLVTAFADRYEVTRDVGWGVIDGFDREPPSPDSHLHEDEYKAGYDIGRMVREAVLP